MATAAKRKPAKRKTPAKRREVAKQLQHVSRLRIPNPRTLDADIRKYMDVCTEKLGLIPNVIRAFTLRPAKLRTFIAKYNELMLSNETRLTRLEREMIATVVSSHNHCLYCITSHSQAVREFSGDPILGDVLMTNYRDANLSKKHRAMLDYAWMLTSTPWLVGDVERDRLRKVGFSDEDIFDISDTTAYFNYTNRMTGGLGMLPNEDYFGMHRMVPRPGK